MASDTRAKPSNAREIADQLSSIASPMPVAVDATLPQRRSASQRLRTVDGCRRVHGVGRTAIIEARGLVPRGRLVLRVLLTFTG